MKTYIRCFVGIPLPETLQPEFIKLLQDTKRLVPRMGTVYPLAPHITMYYLSKQAATDLNQIKTIVQQHASLVAGKTITIGDLDYFTPVKPRVVFLRVSYPPELAKLNQLLTADLYQFYSGENKEFHPHMTIGRMHNTPAQTLFKKQEEKVRKLFAKIHWEFPITEIAIFGVDSTKLPMHQEKLLSVSVI